MILSLKKLDSRGFTLPELISVMVVSAIFIGLIMFFMISFWRYGYLLEADLDTLITRLNAGDVLRESLGSSSGLISQNSLPDAHTNNPDPAIASNLYWTPIHAVPGNTAMPASGATTPLLYYRGLSINTSKNVIMNGVQPYEDEFVLYMDGSTKSLKMRSIANTAAANNKLLTSCPSAVATSTCPADRTIATDIASIDTRYFSRSGNTIDYTSSFDTTTNTYTGPDFPVVEVVELTLHLSKKPIFQKSYATTNTTIIRIALRNT